MIGMNFKIMCFKNIHANINRDFMPCHVNACTLIHSAFCQCDDQLCLTSEDNQSEINCMTHSTFIYNKYIIYYFLIRNSDFFNLK